MNFQEYAKKRLDLEREMTRTTEKELAAVRELQAEESKAYETLQRCSAKADLVRTEMESERQRIRKQITDLELEYTEHGEA